MISHRYFWCTPVKAIFDNTDGFTELAGVLDVTTVVIDDNTYALAAAGADNGVQVIGLVIFNSELLLTDSISISNFVDVYVNRFIKLTDSISISNFVDISIIEPVQQPTPEPILEPEPTLPTSKSTSSKGGSNSGLPPDVRVCGGVLCSKVINVPKYV